MLSDETIGLIHLNLMQGVGSKTVRQLVEAFGSAVAVLKASDAEIQEELQKIGGTIPAGFRLVHYPLERELELIRQHRCSILTFYDDAYPLLLKNINSPPPVLYVKGELKPEDMRSISIVGPREAQDYGRRVSYRLSSQLAKRGTTVVSGLAKGIDACAHRGALDGGGRTIAVLGNGLSTIYPAEHSDLAEQIARSGAFISEFPMDTPPKRKNFPIRNRIISGLTLGTIVVEAPIDSGSLITAKHAHKQGRKVFAVPGQILSERSRGCHELIKNGAILIDEVDDVLEAVRPNGTYGKIPYKTYKTKVIPVEQNLLFNYLPIGSLNEVPSEVVVERAVVGYFRRQFPKYSIELQYEIQMGSYTGRADVVLTDGKKKLLAIAECKKIGYIGPGVEQLQSYLAVTDALFGIFANEKKPDRWTFYEKRGQNTLKQIERSEFEERVVQVP